VRATPARTNAATAAVAAGLDPERYRPIPFAEAEAIQASHNCDGLSAHLRASPHIFGDGWGFVKVVWGERGRPLPYDQVPLDTRELEYLALEVGNKWNDLALYRRIRRSPPPGARQTPVCRRLFVADDAGAPAAPDADPPADPGPSAPEPKPGPQRGDMPPKPKECAKVRLRNNPFSILMDSGSASDGSASDDSDDTA
jgi:hypothetical protein